MAQSFELGPGPERPLWAGSRGSAGAFDGSSCGGGAGARECGQDDQGRLRRPGFPDLWLAVTPLLAGELALVLAELQQRIAADEHTTFVHRPIV